MKKVKNRVIAIVAAMVLIMIAAIPALAEDVNQPLSNGFSYENVSGSKTMEFTKYLIIEKDANIPPDAVFDFTVTAGAPVASSGTTYPVKAGITPEKVKVKLAGGTPTSGTAADSYAISFSGATPESTPTTDIDFNSGTQKYAKQTVVVDFSDVEFTKPGIYRYVITETNPAKFASVDSRVKTIDVYVTNEDTSGSGTTLILEKYVMYDSAVSDAPASGTNPSDAEKTDKFINQYPSCNLKVTKRVSGNLADKSEYFTFNIEISNAQNGTVYDLDLSNLVVNSGADINGALTDKVTVENGKANITVQLQHGQSITIYGIAEGSYYEVQEVRGQDGTSLDQEGYTTTISIPNNNSDLESGTTPTVSGRTITLSSGTGMIVQNEIVFTNTKDGKVPTGIDMKLVPIVMAAIVFMAGIAVLTVRMARKEEQ